MRREGEREKKKDRKCVSKRDKGMKETKEGKQEEEKKESLVTKVTSDKALTHTRLRESPPIKRSHTRLRQESPLKRPSV